jgi:large subunit ribosomal protein L32
MALPKQRHTHHRRDRAREEHDAKLVNTKECPKCKSRILSHRACPTCGTYKGREVKGAAPKVKAKKSAKK